MEEAKKVLDLLGYLLHCEIPAHISENSSWDKVRRKEKKPKRLAKSQEKVRYRK